MFGFFRRSGDPRRGIDPHRRVTLESVESDLDREHELRLWYARPWYRRIRMPWSRVAGRRDRKPTENAASASLQGRAPTQTIEPPPADPNDPWAVDEKQFPRSKGVQAKLRFCVRYAVLAPSSHNTQPWRFRLGLHHADVLADRRHALPVADPDDRELTISCGAAIYHLGLAVECFGMRTECSILPDGSSPDLLARVRVVEGRPEPDPERATMLRAIPKRHTHRGAFEDRDPPPGLIQRFRDLASSLDAGVHVVVGEHDRLALADLIAEADTVQLADRRFRRELASWLHHNRTHSRDGIPGHALGMHELESIAAPLIVRTFDIGHGRAAKDEQIALHSPVLLVIDTPGDTPRDWVAAGRALGAILLKATAAGLGASYLNQPIEVPELRPRVGQIVPEVRCPQLVLRMGYARPAHRTPRRPVDDVCEWTADDPDDDS